MIKMISQKQSSGRRTEEKVQWEECVLAARELEFESPALL